MYILYAVIAIGILILVHELGHFWVARWVKVPAYEFSIGFGKQIWHKKRRETLYSVRMIPFGGYVRFDNPEVENSYLDYYAHPVWKRMLISLAGSLSNVVFAFLIACILFLSSQYQTVLPRIGEVAPHSAAQVAGIQVGDEVIGVDGVQIKGDTEILSAAIARSEGKMLDVTLLRDGHEVQVQLVPQWDNELERYRIGITFEVSELTHLGPVRAVVESGKLVWQYVREIFMFFMRLIFRWEGATQVSGIIGAVTTMSDYGSQYGFIGFLSIIISISMNLAVLNMLPLPALDGSKILFQIIEMIRRKPVSVKLESVVQMVGFAVFGGLFVLLLFRDIFSIFGG